MFACITMSFLKVAAWRSFMNLPSTLFPLSDCSSLEKEREREGGREGGRREGGREGGRDGGTEGWRKGEGEREGGREGESGGRKERMRDIKLYY